MKKNYYDILEINKNASQEIVEKAYKTLAKKYHPDLQDESKKNEAENKMKELNEAYNIISNPETRIAYNQELEKQERIEQIKKQDTYKQSTYKPNNTTIQKQEINTQINNNILRQKEEELLRFEQERQKAINKAYYDAYIQDLKNRGYKIHYKKSLKDYLKGIFCILITLLIFISLLQIPFVKNFFINLYEENKVIKWIVNIFITN